jgi:hypothetical protein
VGKMTVEKIENFPGGKMTVEKSKIFLVEK